MFGAVPFSPEHWASSRGHLVRVALRSLPWGQKGFRRRCGRLSRNIRARRLERNLTQEAVAFDAGLSARHYQQLESGEANPTFATLFEIARVLDSAVVELIAPAQSRIKPRRRRASKNEPQRKSKT